jgi:hypothetical protein
MLDKGKLFAVFWDPKVVQHLRVRLHSVLNYSLIGTLLNMSCKKHTGTHSSVRIKEAVFFPSQSPVRYWYSATGNEMYSPQFGYTDWYHPKTCNRLHFSKHRVLQMPGFGDIISRERGQDSVIGIATCYWLDSLGFEPQWGQDFTHPSRPAPRPTQFPVLWVPRHLPRGKVARVWH